jgi:sugar lactone lactonase YvrE
MCLSTGFVGRHARDFGTSPAGDYYWDYCLIRKPECVIITDFPTGWRQFGPKPAKSKPDTRLINCGAKNAGETTDMKKQENMKPKMLRVAATLLATLTLVSAAHAQPPLPPVIQSQPQSAVVPPGGTATFSVGVTGAGPFTYQWLWNGTNLPNNLITTIAGGGDGTALGDGGLATNASLSHPFGVVLDAGGNLFIADTYHKLIRRVDTNQIITTVAGNGTANYPGDGGAATNAGLNPLGLAVDAAGNLFIADPGHSCIRRVDGNAIITTAAGNGTNGYAGDGGPATKASLSYPADVAVDAQGDLFIADLDNNCVRKVDVSGQITTVAGNGTNGFSGDGGPATKASLSLPNGVTVDATGNLFIAELGDNRIRKVDTNQIITTVAGDGANGFAGDGGVATNASLAAPYSVAVDGAGDLFMADFSNQRVREVEVNGYITTVAGNGGETYGGDGGLATNASLNQPEGAAVDAAGDIFIADAGNNRIREVTFAGPTLALAGVTVTNAGNYQVLVTSPWGSVTSSIVTLTVALTVVPPQLSALLNADGSVTLNLLTTPSTSSQVLAATNLAPPVVWQPLGAQVPDASGIWQFTDTNASQFPQRFYRASTP